MTSLSGGRENRRICRAAYLLRSRALIAASPVQSQTVSEYSIVSVLPWSTGSIPCGIAGFSAPRTYRWFQGMSVWDNDDRWTASAQPQTSDVVPYQALSWIICPTGMSWLRFLDRLSDGLTSSATARSKCTVLSAIESNRTARKCRNP